MIRLTTALVILLAVMSSTIFLPTIQRRPQPIEPPSATSPAALPVSAIGTDLAAIVSRRSTIPKSALTYASVKVRVIYTT